MNEAVLIRFMNSFLKVWEAPQQRCRFESQHTVTSSITSLILPRWGSLWRSLSAHHRHRGLNVILGTLFHHRPSSANVWICVRIMSCLETALKRSSGRKAPATYKQRRNHQMISCLQAKPLVTTHKPILDDALSEAGWGRGSCSNT